MQPPFFTMDNIAIVIPARMASTRFPGKPLAPLGGKPMLQWVYEACLRSEVTGSILIATPDQEIADACASFHAECFFTSPDRPSGTDRIAEVSRSRREELYLNVQGDEPFIPIETIQACFRALVNQKEQLAASVFTDCSLAEELDPSVVKVVISQDMNALYFSRAAIPYKRVPTTEPLKRHLGIYGYSKEVLGHYVSWQQGTLEKIEGLEQLRFLENGVQIRMEKGIAGPTAVDTPEQLEELRRLIGG